MQNHRTAVDDILAIFDNKAEQSPPSQPPTRRATTKKTDDVKKRTEGQGSHPSPKSQVRFQGDRDSSAEKMIEVEEQVLATPDQRKLSPPNDKDSEPNDIEILPNHPKKMKPLSVMSTTADKKTTVPPKFVTMALPCRGCREVEVECQCNL